jgi:hypothetical protein
VACQDNFDKKLHAKAKRPKKGATVRYKESLKETIKGQGIYQFRAKEKGFNRG